jgi:predicted aspartyl protease
LPRRYALTRIGNLLFTRAAVTGPTGTKVINLLVDTGSSFTIIPVEVLESIGLSPAESNRHARIATGSGYIIAPKIKLVSLNTCGKTFRRSTMIGHTLPFGNIVDGLLGMDILFRLNAKILVATGWIDVA